MSRREEIVVQTADGTRHVYYDDGTQDGCMRCEERRYDADRMQLVNGHGERVPLSEREYELMATFPKPIIRINQPEPTTAAVDAEVEFLRQQLEGEQKHRREIEQHLEYTQRREAEAYEQTIKLATMAKGGFEKIREANEQRARAAAPKPEVIELEPLGIFIEPHHRMGYIVMVEQTNRTFANGYRTWWRPTRRGAEHKGSSERLKDYQRDEPWQRRRGDMSDEEWREQLDARDHMDFMISCL